MMMKDQEIRKTVYRRVKKLDSDIVISLIREILKMAIGNPTSYLQNIECFSRTAGKSGWQYLIQICKKGTDSLIIFCVRDEARDISLRREGKNV
jgi:hypothetical protein